MRVITWNPSFKGLPQQDDADDNFDTEESETHATALDKMLAWEKKLYDEAKEGELMKIKYHRKDYIRSLNSWLSLNLVPIENGREEKDSSLSREADLLINILLRVWHEYLDKLLHDLAKNAVHGFAEVISAMLALQDDELKQKSECEDVRKDLARKRWQFEDWHRKYTQRRGALPALEGAESANQAAAVVERRIIVEAVEMKLKEAEENHKKLCKQVRERSIGSLRTHLPELFRAMSDFAFASCQMYKRLRSITQFKGQVKEG